MLALQANPRTLRLAVYDAVVDGAWAPSDVVASVASDSSADRRQIIATLWDLVEDGILVYDASLQFAGFRPCC